MDPASADHALLESVAQGFGLTLPRPTIRGLLQFFGGLLRWNERINLTGARTMKELLEEHLPDSFALADLVPPAASLVDVGSGGGLPALPLALLRPDIRLTLVEPRAKRVAFLRSALRDAGVQATVIPDRLESLAQRFEVANARATFAPAEWLQRAQAVVEPGGLVILLLSGHAEVPPYARVERSLAYQAGTKGRVAVAARL